MTPPNRPLFANSKADLGALVKEPQQARSRQTLARILQASIDLLRTEGPDALTVTRIARKAKSSVGSFYARFDGKEDLVRYVGEHALGDAAAAWDELLRGMSGTTDTAEACDALVRGLGDLLTEGPALPLVLLDGLEESERARMRRFEDEVASGLRVLAGSDVAARVASMALTSVLSQAARDLGEGGRARLTDELVRLVVGYFGASMPEGPADPGPAENRATEERREPSEGAGEESPSPWDRAASELVGSGTSTRPSEPTAQPPPADPDTNQDAIADLEVAFRDLGAEMDDSGSAEDDDDVPEVEADPFDVWG